MRDEHPLERLRPGEAPAFIVATSADDTHHVPSEHDAEVPCSECCKKLLIDEKSQGLMPLPVYCLQCFRKRHLDGNVIMRRAR